MPESPRAERRRAPSVSAGFTTTSQDGAETVKVDHVLMIEDVDSQAHFISGRVLATFPDATLRREATLREGIEAAGQDPPQVVLCDLGLPDSSGTATIEKLRHAVPNSPIIAMTSGDKHGLECLMVGADDFLDKQDMKRPGAVERSFTFTLTRWYQQAEVQYLAQHDYLTSLLTRAAVEHRYLRLLSNAREAGYSLGVVVCDLNHFKSVNDCCGHEAGDRILKEFAAGFEDSFRQLDIVGRWGGDEFLAVVALPDPEKMNLILTRLQGLTVEYHDPLGERRSIGASYGSAIVAAEESPQLESLIRTADASLLEAKRIREGGHPRSG